ncbi:MAG: adenylate kinase family protein [Thermoplasmata archaeon]
MIYLLPMIICISGTPGTGKTYLSSRFNSNVINLNDFSKRNGCTKGYDRKRKSEIVNVECLKKKLKNVDNIILEGHYAHLLKCNIVIILRTSPKILKKRLIERGYDLQKIQENLEAEALGIITQEALKMNENVYEIDTTSLDIDVIMNEIRKILNGEGGDYKAGKIDYMEEILEWF